MSQLPLIMQFQLALLAEKYWAKVRKPAPRTPPTGFQSIPTSSWFGIKELWSKQIDTWQGQSLALKNINDSIDSQIHQCAYSLHSQLNRDMLDTAKAFYFHGEIIPAEQVFAEIPQTRAYYERYCGKLE